MKSELDLYQRLQKQHRHENENCELKNISIEDIKNLQEKHYGTYCPGADVNKCQCNICEGVLDIIYLIICPKCNRCQKWTPPEGY